MDKIWGIGFRWKNGERMEAHWGLNSLGMALMNDRDLLRVEAEEKEGEKELGENIEESDTLTLG